MKFWHIERKNQLRKLKRIIKIHEKQGNGNYTMRLKQALSVLDRRVKEDNGQSV